MGIRPSFQLMCGIHNFPVDTDGYPIVSAAGAAYPCFVPTNEYPLWERSDEEIPLPALPTSQEFTAIIDSRDELEIQYWMKRKMLHDRLTTRDGNPKKVEDLFEWNSGEYGTAGLYGTSIGDYIGASQDDFRYGLASLDEKYHESGYELLPSMGLDDFRGYLGERLSKLIFEKQHFPEAVTRDYLKKINLHELNQLKRDIRNKQCYQFFRMEFDTHADTAMWVLRHLGFQIHRRDLHLIMKWEWS